MKYIVEATLRDGSSGPKMLRRQGRVPAIMYGAQTVVPFSCDHRDLSSYLQDETFRSSVIVVQIDGKKHSVLLREVQRHPARRDILHVDFQEIRQDHEISVQLPIHFINIETAPGVKLQHGIFTAIENQIAARCLPKDLPEFIEIDVGILEIGKNIHLSEITPPPNVRFDEITRGNDPALAVISSASAEEETTTTPEDETANEEQTDAS